MVSTDKLLVVFLAGLHWGVEETSKSAKGSEASQGQRWSRELGWVWHHRDDRGLLKKPNFLLTLQGVESIEQIVSLCQSDLEAVRVAAREAALSFGKVQPKGLRGTVGIAETTSAVSTWLPETLPLSTPGLAAPGQGWLPSQQAGSQGVTFLYIFYGP